MNKKVSAYITKINNIENISTIWICAWIFLFVFQRPLESVSRIFKLIDEVCAVGLFAVIILRWKQLRQYLKLGWVKALIAALGVFFAAGIAGNVIYRYQPLKYVLLDIFTNAKFYMVLAASMLICSEGTVRQDTVRRLVYVLSAGLFVLFIFDRIFGIWPGEIRRGISSACLFYGHPTYFAGVMTLLLSLLLVFYTPRNLPFILMDMVMMAFTMRSKAFGGVAALAVLLVWVVCFGKKVKFWHIGVSAAALATFAWKQINFYYIHSSESARAILTKTSFRVFLDYLPIGTGFGTFASNAANIHYSPVYRKYGFLSRHYGFLWKKMALEYIENGVGEFVYQIGELGSVYSEVGPKSPYLNDTFWPIILGQTGLIGTIAYLGVVGILFVRIWKLQSEHRNLFAGGMFILAYILISSTSEPAFNNAVAIPLAMVLGYCLAAESGDKKKAKGE